MPWTCEACTYINANDAKSVCEICGTARIIPAKANNSAKPAAAAATAPAAAAAATVASSSADAKKQSASAAASPPADREAVPLLPALSYLPRVGVVASYGGGGDMQLSRQIAVRACPLSIIPSDLKASILAEIPKALTRNAAIARADRVAHLPEKCPDLNTLTWSAHAQLSTHVYGCDKFNLFYHALLYDVIASEAGRKGAIRYPLIGLWNATGIQKPGGGVADIGFNSLKWADQHIHHLEESDPTWYFGSDMAIFRPVPNAAFSTAWCVAVDLTPERMACDVMFLVICDPSVEDGVERALRGKNAFRSGAGGIGFLDALSRSVDAKHFTANPTLLSTLKDVVLSSFDDAKSNSSAAAPATATAAATSGASATTAAVSAAAPSEAATVTSSASASPNA